MVSSMAVTAPFLLVLATCCLLSGGGASLRDSSAPCCGSTAPGEIAFGRKSGPSGELMPDSYVDHITNNRRLSLGLRPPSPPRGTPSPLDHACSATRNGAILAADTTASAASISTISAAAATAVAARSTASAPLITAATTIFFLLGLV
ncbi:hypothetical protein Taro_003493 [Colocasia esculenta]|uniref:Uncharacterized protein n=1 Tax=Colocasia esculenta TaxID=4460 RepID=A0A843TM92_COLES|nr:hypothetical protein [Colocasia esculenta]